MHEKFADPDGSHVIISVEKTYVAAVKGIMTQKTINNI
jgi:hypothetical protein